MEPFTTKSSYEFQSSDPYTNYNLQHNVEIQVPTITRQAQDIQLFMGVKLSSGHKYSKGLKAKE